MSKFSEFSNKNASPNLIDLQMKHVVQCTQIKVSGKGICKRELRNVANEWCYIKMSLSFMLKI